MATSGKRFTKREDNKIIKEISQNSYLTPPPGFARLGFCPPAFGEGMLFVLQEALPADSEIAINYSTARFQKPLLSTV